MVDINIVSDYEKGYLTVLQYSNIFLIVTSGILLYLNKSEPKSGKRLYLIGFVLATTSIILVNMAFRDQLHLLLYHLNADIGIVNKSAKLMAERITDKSFLESLHYVTYVPSLQIATLGILFTGAVWNDYLYPYLCHCFKQCRFDRFWKKRVRKKR